MEILFRKQILADLYDGKNIKDNRFKSNPMLIRQYIKTVKKLKEIKRLEDLFAFKSLNYEKLTGDRKGYSSVRLNEQYRLIFEEIITAQKPFVVTILALEEISNHYH